MNSKQVAGRKGIRSEHRWWYRASGLFTVYCLLSTSLLPGCGGGIRKKIESGIAQGMTQKIGPAKRYSVKVSGPTMALVSGKLKGIEIAGEDVRTAKGITVSRLRVNIDDLVVDTDTMAIKKCAGTTYAATLSQEELQRYLVKTYPDIPGLEIQLLNDFARVKAKPGLSVARLPIVVDATLDIQDRRKLALNLREVDIAGIPTPAFARDYVERKINPVLDVADLGIGARVDSVRIGRGAITIAGTLDLLKAAGGAPRPARDPEAWER